MTAIVDVQDVSYIRQGKAILDSVSCQIEAGQHWVILGPNGAGKTTLAALIAGRAHPTRGRVSVLDEELGYVSTTELHQRIGFASSNLLPRIPAGQRVMELMLAAAYGTLADARFGYEEVDLQRAQALLDLFGVGHLGERIFETLSDGERQRVLIGRALMGDPEMLILDEPAAGLDMGARAQLLGALTELAGDRRSPVMILITHHVEEIPPGFTHAALLGEGKIAHAGPVGEVITSANLSAVFQTPLQIRNDNGRFAGWGA